MSPNDSSSKHKDSLKNSVEVYARIRKVNNGTHQSCIKVLTDIKLQLFSPAVSKITECQFSQVFNTEVEQKDIFVKVAKPLIDDLLLGKNGLLFTYGVTNSGKTYTMTGTVKEPGLLPRSLDMIFNSVAGLQAAKYRFIPDDMNGFYVQSEAEALLHKQEKDILPRLHAVRPHKKAANSNPFCYEVEHCYSENIDAGCRYAVFVSYIEIYNESVFDLLDENVLDNVSKTRSLPSKRLREDIDKNVYIYDATQIEVMSTEEAFLAFQQGQEKRRIAHTRLNAVSSRSHSIFNIKLVQAPMDSHGEDLSRNANEICVSQLSLVDLAGTERISRTRSKNDRLREAGNINNSLMTLRRCLVQLRENQKNKGRELINYRNSKLTHLFKSYFEGHGKVKMVLCLNPNIKEFEENLHVVQFAELAQEVEVARTKMSDHCGARRRLHAGRFDETYCSAASLNTQNSDTNTASTCSYHGSNEAVGYSKDPWEGVYFDFGIFPSVKVNDCSDFDTLPNLIEHLENHIAITDHIKDFASSMCSLFRKNVVNGTLSNRELRNQIVEVEGELSRNVKEVAKLDRQVKKMESKNQILSKTTLIYEKDKKQLQDQLSNVEMQLKNSQIEKRRVEFNLDEVVSSTKLEAKKIFDRRVRNVQSELEEQLQAKEDRLQQLRTILASAPQLSSSKAHSSASIVLQSESNASGFASSRLVHRRRSQSTEPLFIEKKKSKTSTITTTPCSSYKSRPSKQDVGVNVGDEPSEGLRCSKSPSQATVPKQIYASSELFSQRKRSEECVDEGQGDSTSNVRDQEVSKILGCHFVNRNDEHLFRDRLAPPVATRHRRSCCSNNSNWLSHFPSTTIKPETILQPAFKPNRVVNVPSPKDVACASKYVLTHQCEDTEGELETRLVKGEVFKTRSGGQQVQFVDVETLKQSDPQKNQSSSNCTRGPKCQKREEYSEEESSWTDVEARCAYGIGSGNVSPPQPHGNTGNDQI